MEITWEKFHKEWSRYVNVTELSDLKLQLHFPEVNQLIQHPWELTTLGWLIHQAIIRLDICYDHWKLKVISMPTLPLLVAP